MNDPYKISVDALKRTCQIMFYFEDGTCYQLPTRYYPGIEEDVRHNYYAWRAHAVAYNQERARFNTAIDALFNVEMKG